MVTPPKARTCSVVQMIVQTAMCQANRGRRRGPDLLSLLAYLSIERKGVTSHAQGPLCPGQHPRQRQYPETQLLPVREYAGRPPTDPITEYVDHASATDLKHRTA